MTEPTRERDVIRRLLAAIDCAPDPGASEVARAVNDARQLLAAPEPKPGGLTPEQWKASALRLGRAMHRVGGLSSLAEVRRYVDAVMEHPDGEASFVASPEPGERTPVDLPGLRRVIGAVVEAVEAERISTAKGAEIVAEWLAAAEPVEAYLTRHDLWNTLEDRDDGVTLEQFFDALLDRYPVDVWPDAEFTDAQAATVLRRMLPRIRDEALLRGVAAASAPGSEP